MKLLNKKGDVEWNLKLFGEIILVLLMVILIFYVASNYIGIFLGGSEVCSNSIGGFNFLTDFVSKYEGGEFSEQKTFIFSLRDECVIIPFNKIKKGEPNTDVTKRPFKCGDKACLCLCDKGGKDISNVCEGGYECKTFKELEGFDLTFDYFSKQGSFNYVIIPINKVGKKIVFDWAPSIDSKQMVNIADGFDSKIFQNEGKLYKLSNLDLEELDLDLFVEDGKLIIALKTSDEGTLIAEKSLGFSGGLFIVDEVYDENCDGSSCLKFGGKEYKTSKHYSHEHVYVTHHGGISAFILENAFYGAIERDTYILYEGVNLYFIKNINENILDKLTIEFLDISEGLSTYSEGFEEDIDSLPITYDSYKFNINYKEDVQKKIEYYANHYGVPVKLALALGLHESSLSHEDSSGDVKIGFSGDIGLFQINQKIHKRCWDPGGEGICTGVACKDETPDDIDCNIDAAMNLLKQNYAECIILGSYLYNCPECGKVVTYYDWSCALRLYNGKGCGWEGNSCGAIDYVDNVILKMEEFSG